MKITVEKSDNLVEFSTIKRGEVFKRNNHYYLRVDDTINENNAILLSSGYNQYKFHNSDKVMLCEASMNIKE